MYSKLCEVLILKNYQFAKMIMRIKDFGKIRRL